MCVYSSFDAIALILDFRGKEKSEGERERRGGRFSFFVGLPTSRGKQAIVHVKSREEKGEEQEKKEKKEERESENMKEGRKGREGTAVKKGVY